MPHTGLEFKFMLSMLFGEPAHVTQEIIQKTRPK